MLNEFLNQQFTFSINGLALAGILIFALISFISILSYINHLLRRIRSLETPKYGFLGKPLYTLVLMLVMVGGLGFFGYSFTQQQDFQISAKKVITSQIGAEVVSEQASTVTVHFSATPYINGTAWGGNDTDSFDIYWNIRGPQAIDRFEVARTRVNPGGFNTTLPKGEYTINLLIVYEGSSESFIEKVVI